MKGSALQSAAQSFGFTDVDNKRGSYPDVDVPSERALAIMSVGS